jgi:hypothetical protein
MFVEALAVIVDVVDAAAIFAGQDGFATERAGALPWLIVGRTIGAGFTRDAHRDERARSMHVTKRPRRADPSRTMGKIVVSALNGQDPIGVQTPTMPSDRRRGTMADEPVVRRSRLWLDGSFRRG